MIGALIFTSGCAVLGIGLALTDLYQDGGSPWLAVPAIPLLMWGFVGILAGVVIFANTKDE
jgi:hypothetical protein